jgi:nicotinate-nucleotide--dimethylbenzimidazole phosphoribosyltransferase
MDSADGTGAALAWPMIRAAAALLTDLHEVAEARLAVRPAPGPGTHVPTLGA